MITGHFIGIVEQVDGIYLVIPVALFILLAVGVILGRRPEVCPSCHQRKLRCLQWVRATIVRDGKRAPDSWSYLLCDSCGARYKQRLGGDFEIPSEQEWAKHCSCKPVKS